MKTLREIVGASSIVALLVCLTVTESAQAPQQRLPLPLSPLSSSVLIAQAIHSGKMHLPASGKRLSPNVPTAQCSPSPCVLPNVQASEGGGPVNETPIVSNPKNAKQLLTGGNDYNCPVSLQGFYTSSDRGLAWSHTCMNIAPGEAFGAGDPAVGYDRLNTAYIAGIEFDSTFSNGVIAFEKSHDNGFTWSAPAVAVRSLFTPGLTDKEWLQIDTNPGSPYVNTLYISVTDFDLSSPAISITVSHSSDGGATWTTSVVDTVNFPTVDQFSDLAIAKDGAVYVSWQQCTAGGSTGDCGGTTASMMLSKSTDGGNTWSAPAVIATVNLVPDGCSCAFYGSLPNTNERVSNIPVLGIANHGPFKGNLYAVMYNWTGTQMEVEVTSSGDGGVTWETSGRVAPPTATHDQFFPWLSVSNNGTVGVTWLDRRNDPANISYEVFAAVFSPASQRNFDLSSTPSNPFNDGFGGFFMGDYIGNTWADNTLYASWTDTRTGVAQDERGGLRK